jgi:hypothetical protein
VQRWYWIKYFTETKLEECMEKGIKSGVGFGAMAFCLCVRPRMYLSNFQPVLEPIMFWTSNRNAIGTEERIHLGKVMVVYLCAWSTICALSLRRALWPTILCGVSIMSKSHHCTINEICSLHALLTTSYVPGDPVPLR